MSDVPIDLAILWALLGSSILYGVHAVTFGNAVRVLIFKKRRQARHPHLIVATFLLFSFGTAYIAVAFRHVLDAFVWYAGPGGAKGQLSQISDVLANVKNSLYIAQVLTGDAMLIYRCFMVYGRAWWIVVIPIILWIGCAILGAFVVYIPFTLHMRAVLSVSNLKPFITSAMALTLAINIFCTSMIVHRIWLTQQRSLRIFGSDGVIRGQSFSRAIGIIVESAAMYTVTSTIFFALELRTNNAEYSVAECVVQIIGIAFNLIIIRVDQGQSIETQAATSTAIHTPRVNALQPRRRSSSGYLSSRERSGASSCTPLPLHTEVVLQPLGKDRQSSVESFGKERFKSSDDSVKVVEP